MNSSDRQPAFQFSFDNYPVNESEKEIKPEI
jgi:hypothetical protein